ncbi:cohesin domain-containing protein [Pseudoalteromonas luteoviolacea]|uniref:Cohesin domain-containing protein n=1 Tax=Pseudoalteromonas luteoviolacea S4054 TaxID=1129367 RepID=A0A0F6A8V1_9GAMM|nr:cohesin domain-containing protein [Pseudoalteromonas luteoviolacea]AOT10887.1 hypothetical protein S4054249_23880 [Pseudoalteromonas luteoviolacea]AOT15950.1 hypothetical protein S40542_24630 [Pseudoalteromonas luteoviolacea]AOT20708.1 hypothetical protein S4054_23800 [Pseudoalteromonas luteoviolacea]KKE81809.1 hypothetical protein N479_02285 [Pseudoalteromonas luteoviolacea S4054]KZN66233.1 hypothetical protein N481_24795 [Pseudoalteromonas luteoviolacea S4047-1]
MQYLITAIFCFLSTAALASEGRVTLETPNQQVKTGSQFYIDINVHDVPEVYGVHLVLKYDPAQLKVLDQDEKMPEIQLEHGNFLDEDRLFVLKNAVSVQGNTIDYIVSQMAPANSVSGSGRIARVFFEARSNATKSDVTIEKADFGTKDGQSLTFTTDSTLSFAFDSAFEVVSPPPTNHNSTMLFAAIVSIMVIISLIVLLRRKRDEHTSTEKA